MLEAERREAWLGIARRGAWRLLVLMAAGLMALLLAAGNALADGSTATYSATETIPVPPASSFEGSGGGDGWAVALSSTQVFNVFHHDTVLVVACHNQTDASDCWPTESETITDASNNNFATSGQPGLYLDQNTGKLYVYATRTSDGTGGVVCIDTTEATSTSDPFCGFIALTAPGDAPISGSGISSISDPMLSGGKWYAFNYVDGAGTNGGENHLLCLDTTTDAACSGQPYSVSIGSGTTSVNSFPEPATALIGSQIIIPITVGGSDELACYDTGSGSNCTGSWPVPLGFSFSSQNGAPFPLLDASGHLTGLCLPTGTDQCYTLSGSSTSTASGMTGVIGTSGGTSPWNGPAFVLGPRVYVPDGNANSQAGQVECYDYSTAAACANFPKTFQNLSYLYTVNADPQRPTCIWVNSDSGQFQIQDFDAYTGGACGQGSIRVLASQFVVDTPLCTPASYSKIQVLQPDPTTYNPTGSTLEFDDGDGNPIATVSPNPQNLDPTGSVSLVGMGLNTAAGLPQFLFTLNGVTGQPASVQVQLTWTGTYDTSCAEPGTTVTTSGNPPPPPPPVCPAAHAQGSPPNCGPAPPPDVSGGGPPTATCADHVRSFGPFTVYGACFTEPKPGVFLASGRVRLNGVDIDPGASGSVTIDTSALSITATGNVSVRLGTFQIFHKTGTWKKSIKLPLTLSSPSGLKVKGLPISGQLDLAPVPDGMDVTAQAGIGFLHLTGDVGLHLSNQAGLSVKKLDIKVGNVPLGPLASIQGGSLAYSHTSDGHDKWSAMVTVKLPPGFPTMMGNLEILDGTLCDIGVNANDINRDFFGIVFLQSLGLDVKLVPHVAVTGSLGLSAGPKIPVLHVKALSLSASLTADFGQPVVFTATGKLKVADKVDLANATARWAVPRQFSATGHIEGSIGPSWLGVHASADAAVAVASDGFAVKGQGSVSVGPTNGQGLVYVSEKGIVALAYASGPTVLGVTIAPVCAGVGYHWGGSVDWYADDGCAGAMSFSSSGHFASKDARQASSSYRIKVPPGETQVELGATAAHGYPEFTLRSPSGHLISGAAGTIGTLGRGTYLFVADPARHGTYVLISRPESGTWTLTPTAASVAITDVARATIPPPVHVRTRVRRRGALWLLTWHASALSGATLRFSDVGPLGEKTITTTSRSAGSARFANFNDGVGGRHHIEILVARNGLPQATVVGSSFTILRPSGPPKPHALRLRHQRSTAVLTWAPAPGAYLYAILITTSDGQHKFYDQLANQRRVTLGRVFASDVVSASIRTVALTGLQSRPASINLRVSVKPRR